MKSSFFHRDGFFSPIKFFLTLTWILFLIMFGLLIVAIYLSIFSAIRFQIDLIQIVLNGVTVLAGQLIATQGIDTWRQNVKSKVLGTKDSGDGPV